MSDNRRRKLSFLGHGPPPLEGEDAVLLDEEMERAVWAEAEPRPPEPRLPLADGRAPPRRDHAAPHPRAADYSPPATGRFHLHGGADGDSGGDGDGGGGLEPDGVSSPPLHLGSSDSEPLVSPRSGSESASEIGSPREENTRHVQFKGGKAADADAAQPEDDVGDERRRLERHTRHLHPHKTRKYSLQESGRSGEGGGRTDEGSGTGALEGEEPLPEADRDELRSHRVDDPRALRRHKIQSKGGVGASVGGGVGDRAKIDRTDTVDSNHNNMYDHSPHSVFVQLDELLATEEGAAEWKETARWIKYEQDVEAGSARWGRPHVASLSFHSLINLRRCLEAGVVLLDLDEKDLPAVAYRVVESMTAEGLIAEDDRPAVLRSLLLRHRHVHADRPRFSIAGGAGGRKHSSYTSLQSLWLEEGGNGAGAGATGVSRVRCSLCSANGSCRRHSTLYFNISEKRRRSSFALSTNDSKKKGSVPTSESGSAEVEYAAVAAAAAAAAAGAGGSHEELRRAHPDPIMRRIPEDAEATTVLVGAVNFLAQPTIAFVRLARGILMPAVTEVPVPVRFMFILLGPANADLDYHEVGRSISTLMSNGSFHDIAYRAEDRRELLSAINEFLDESIVLPPGDWERSDLLPLEELRAKADLIRRRKRDAQLRRRTSAPGVTPAPADEKKALLEAETAGAPGLPPKQIDDPLTKTGRIFGGVVRDVKQRYPFYPSDFRDALNGQCIAAAIFMYFAALSSAIAFGGLYKEKTHGNIGISETLVLTCGGGILFALLAGQPLMITGATGPLLLLDESLYAFCESHGYDYLAARMYSGLWMVVIALLVAFFEGSVAVKFITRFTEDIFAFLISLIFISEPITAMVRLYHEHPLSADYCTHLRESNDTSTMSPSIQTLTPYPNTALFCTMLTLSTFALAYYLRIFRNGKFLGRSARRALGDFGVPLAIVVAVAVSALTPVWTEKLEVPAGLSPTLKRGWFVPLNPGLETISFPAALLMALPACMVYIIVFMETHIAELIVAKPERKLKKGSGFHMDIVLMSCVNAICGLTGAPWQCVATVRSVSHVAALTVMSTTHAPGDKPHVVEVKEQRVTGLLVSLLVGLSALAAGALKLVPMAVLFGVFLYMGVSALGNIQFWERCVLLLKPVKHHPQVPYVRRVPTLKMHLYTLIQVCALAALYAIKSSSLSLAFPLFLVLCVPLRMSLARLFTPLELRALDGAQKDNDKDDEPDFYEEAPLPG